MTREPLSDVYTFRNNSQRCFFMCLRFSLLSTDPKAEALDQKNIIHFYTQLIDSRVQVPPLLAASAVVISE